MLKTIIIAGGKLLAYITDQTKLWLSYNLQETEPNSLFLAATYVPGFEYALNWPVKNAIVDLLISMNRPS